jgi:hypothetical protein
LLVAAPKVAIFGTMPIFSPYGIRGLYGVRIGGNGMSVKKTAFILMIAAGVFVTSSGGSYAFDAAGLERFKATKECRACDLTNADLSKADLRGAKLMEAKLNEANLERANLTGAQLYFADLTGANIKGTKFSRAQLTNATWIDGQLCAHGSLGQCKKE